MADVDAISDQEAAVRAATLMRLAGLNSFLIDGDAVYPSAGLCRAFGLSENQPIDRAAFRTLLHPDDVQIARDCTEKLLREGGSTTVHLRLRDGDDYRFVRVTAMAETRRDGRVVIHALEQDVTELARVRDAALLAERQVRGLMEEARVGARRLKLSLGVAQAGVFEIDHEKGRFWCSPEFVLLAGQRMSFVEAAGIWPFIHPEDVPALRKALDTWETGSMLNHSLDLRLARRDGQVRWARLYYELRRDRGRRLKHCVGMLLDIDERKRGELALGDAERAAHAANETKSRFLASMSHEIRTPMNGVLGVLHLLRAEDLSDGGRKLLDEALQCGHMLSELINDILDLSKIEADQMQLWPEPTDPAAALRGVANMLRPQAEAKGLVLAIEGEPECGWSSIDPVRLRQALFNLMGNAVKFTHEGHVIARLGHTGEGEGKRLRFELEDTGVGIPEEAQARLFGRFQQADNSASRQFGGTGLGLAITRHLVRLMGGEVGFRSVEGQGSTFWFDISAPDAPRPMALPQADADGLEGLRVLVVEDNAANRMIVRNILENLGAEVELAEDGASGVEAARTAAPSLILMDVQMPGMDGLEATRRIRALPGPAGLTPIIALTANVLEHQRRAYLECGMDGVVGKPISPAALLKEILRLAGSQLTPARASRAEAG